MPFPIPTVGAFSAPTVTTSINKEWVTFILGALESLLIPPAFGQSERGGIYASNPAPIWEGDDEQQYLADQEVQKIIEAFMLGQIIVTIPTGTIMPTLSGVIPDGWLKCDGATYGALTYPDLWTVLPDTFKTPINFTVPNLEGRALIGDGGVYELGSTGGAATHVLTLDEIPSHGHNVDAHNHSIPSHGHTTQPHSHTQVSHAHDINVREGATALGTAAIATANSTGALTTRSSVSATPTINSQTVVVNDAPATVTGSANPATDNIGGGNGHNNMQPYLVVTYMIKT